MHCNKNLREEFITRRTLKRTSLLKSPALLGTHLK